MLRRTWIDYEVDVHAGAEELGQLLGDLDGWPAWTPGLLRIERVDEGPVRVGLRFRMVVRLGKGPTLTLPCEVYTWEARRLEWGGGFVGGKVRHFFEIEPLGAEQSRVRQVEYATGVLALVAWPFEAHCHAHDRGWSDALVERFMGRAGSI
ncbi:MAG: SRPBCC family protein [Myxococcales bacterium]|nr:SRPBCC family protein [Myxococcales bacterium]